MSTRDCGSCTALILSVKRITHSFGLWVTDSTQGTMHVATLLIGAERRPLFSNRWFAGGFAKLSVVTSQRCMIFSNAFACPSHEALANRARLMQLPFPGDLHMCQHVQKARFTLPCVEGRLTCTIGSGTLPGDSVAGPWFLSAFHPRIDAYIDSTQHLAVWADCSWLPSLVPEAQWQSLPAPVSGAIDVSLSADDFCTYYAGVGFVSKCRSGIF